MTAAPDPVGPPRADEITALAQELARMHRALGSLKAAVLEHSPQHGIELSAYHLLGLLVRDGAQRASALAEEAHIDPSTASRQTAQLVKAGLVDRQPDPADGRACLLVATDRGTAAFDLVKARRRKALDLLLAHWTTDEVNDLTALLARFNHDIAASRPALLDDLARRSTSRENA